MEPPIAVCTFGWGQQFRLYRDYLDVNGTQYALSTLTHIRPIYRHVMGIASVRLELRFGKKEVLLRGVVEIAAAQRVVEYLTSQVESQPLLQEQSPDISSNSSQDLSRKERALEQAQALTAKVETPTPDWQRFRQGQRERRQRRIHVERSLREHGFDVEKLARRLKSETLPDVPVPMRLLPGERAHYRTDATLCGEPLGGALRYTYPAKDHGTLILTNKRLVYMGRKSQIVLDYARLLHVSRLRGALAFQADHWYKREIFEVRRSLECAMHLESILEHFQQAQPLEEDQYQPAVEIDTAPLSQRHWGMAEEQNCVHAIQQSGERIG